MTAHIRKRRNPAADLEPLVCVATPNIDVVSETFIRSHISRLPMPTCVLHGHPLSRDEHNHTILPRYLLAARAFRVLRRVFTRSSEEDTGPQRILARHLRRRRVAVVLAEYGPTGVEMLDICKRARVPLVVHFHGYDAYQQHALASAGLRYLELFAYSDAIIVVSSHMRQQLLRLGAPTEKLHVIPCGVDTAIFNEVESGGAPPHLLAVGRFVEKKAPHLLVVAMSHVLRHCPEARLTMIGTGPLLPVCRQLAAALRIDHAIDFPGALQHSAVAHHMRSVRAFVQHSITASDGDSEGTPVAILEAQLSGLPTIATRHTGIVDCVVDGRTGLLVEEGDVQGMAAHMVRLLCNPDEAATLGKAAKLLAMERYPLERALARLATVLRNVAGS